MKTKLLKFCMLLCLLTIGVGNAWGEEATLVFSAACNGAGTDNKQNTWTITSDAAESTFDSTKGIHYGTSKKAVSYLTLTTSNIKGVISIIEIEASGASKTSAKLDVMVGESTFGTQESLTSSNAKYTFEGSASGTINVTLSQNSTSNALYVKSIKVTYSNGEGGETKYSINVDNNITGGSISADATSATEGTKVKLTATPDDGYEFTSWSVYADDNEIVVTDDEFDMPASDVEVSAKFTEIQQGGDDIPTGVYFQKVTSSADIVNGGEYIIVYEGAGVTYAAEYISGNNSLSKIQVNRTGNKIYNISSANVFTLQATEGNYFKIICQGFPEKECFLRGYSGKTDLKVSYSSSEEYDQWSFNVSENNVVINNKKLISANYPRQIRYNTSDSKFANYQHTNNEGVTLYRKILPHVTITLNAACHDLENKVFGTYSSSNAWKVPSNITVSEISIIDGELYVEDYETGAVVPANTGVMVSAQEGGGYDAEISSETGTSVLGDGNCLRPSGDAGITDGEMASADANCTYYRLTMHGGTQIGFWWGAADGAAFSLAANKAYLAVPSGTEVKANGMWFGNSETAIENLMSEKSNSVIYNVAGQRVSKATKGLYIKDGKKYLVK